MAVNRGFLGLALALAMGVNGACYVSYAAAEASSSNPDAEQVINAIFTNSDTALPSAQNCGEEKISVGRYFQRALVTMEEQPGGAVLNARCDRVAVNQDLIDLYTTDLYPSRTGDALRAVGEEQSIYQCDLTLAPNESERPWSRELRFLMYAADHSAVEGSFRCLTSP